MNSVTTQSELYSSIADQYQQRIAPARYLWPAQAMVEMMNLEVGASILDVGCGTGIAIPIAKKAAGPGGFIVGLEPAISMVARARKEEGGPNTVVAGALPLLPFRRGIFDAAIANFILSHVADYKSGIEAIASTVKHGGSIGLTSWGPAPTHLVEIWRRGMERRRISIDLLDSLSQEVIPWESYFEDISKLELAAETSGLTIVESTTISKHYSMTAHEYVEMRSALVSSRILQSRVADRTWRKLTECIKDDLRSAVGDKITYKALAHIVIARR